MLVRRVQTLMLLRTFQVVFNVSFDRSIYGYRGYYN